MSGIVARCRATLSDARVRHYGGFALGGALAFVTDGGVLMLLNRGLAMSPFLARPIGIGAAIVVSWWINRTITFAHTLPPSLAELLRFAAVSGSAQVVNYGVFAAALLAVPSLEPLIAFVLACLVSMVISYNGYRHGVFGGHDR